MTGTSPSTTTHSRAYTYDAAGNRTGLSVDGGSSQTSTYNNGEQLTASPGQTYSYDDNGQLTAQTDTGTSAVTSYTYDPTGQVTSEGSDTFENDPLGRRTKESHSSVDTNFLYDGNDVIQSKLGSDDPFEYARDASGSLLGEYVSGSTPETYNYYTDLLGSVTGLSRNSDRQRSPHT